MVMRLASWSDKCLRLLVGKGRTRTRTMLTDEQLLELEKVFEDTTYPTREMRENLSSRLNLPARKIQVNFPS